ncbi:MAG: hypothetical protein COA47_09910 [Robiginitomaculum sp.]|nr:MAG: hypothetical protein COA47_09910 [Robiginitomaculum sp.]
MNYWFVANGRRFIVVADVNGTWATMYAGFMLPYATPSEMPYPMYIAGNAGAEDTDSTEVSDKVGSIFDPVGTLVTPGTNSAYLRDFNGGWISISNYAWATGISRNNQSTGAWVWPYNWMYSEDLAGDIIIQNPDGSTTTLPCVIHASINGGNVFGELDGVVFMSGVSRSPADTLTIGGDTYLVVRSSFRQNTSFDFAAINLA